jgi:DNA (cytosine-5)-methyltransferase 1
MDNDKMFNVVDIFCGAGGLSAGFAKAGFNIASGIDNNEHALQTFNRNHNCRAVTGDVQEDQALSKLINSINRRGLDIDDIDVVIGGPPCRGFSMANVESNSEENPLNDLPNKFLDIVERIDPEGVLIENVPRLLTMADGQFRDSILSSLQEMDFEVDYEVLNAVRFGVPQKRRRVFFIGIKNSEPEWPSADDIEFRYSSPVDVESAISDLPPLPTGGGGNKEMTYDSNYNELSDYAQAMRSNAESGTVRNHRTTVNQEETYRRFKHIPQGGNWEDIPEDLMHNYTDRKRTHDHIYQRLEQEKPAKTVANFRKQMIVHPTQDRLLSVREAARLQSFPDDYIFEGDSFNARQQMVGDAVPVNLAFSLATVMKSGLEKAPTAQGSR